MSLSEKILNVGDYFSVSGGIEPVSASIAAQRVCPIRTAFQFRAIPIELIIVVGTSPMDPHKELWWGVLRMSASRNRTSYVCISDYAFSRTVLRLYSL